MQNASKLIIDIISGALEYIPYKTLVSFRYYTVILGQKLEADRFSENRSDIHRFLGNNQTQEK